MITNDGNETAPEAEVLDAQQSNEHCVPLAALALEGTAPAVGDTVEFTVSGRVARVEGGKAYVQAENINGEPVPQEKTPADEDAAMMAEAERADAAAV